MSEEQQFILNHQVNADFYKQGYEDARKHFLATELNDLKSAWFAHGYTAGVLEASETLIEDQTLPSKPLDQCCMQAFVQARVYARIALCGIDLRPAAIYSKFVALQFQVEKKNE